jgi:hypothetical protein
MRKSQNDAFAGEGESASLEPGPDRHASAASVPDSEVWSAIGMDDGAVAGGLTLLSRSPAPQGRRSLFRR